MKDQRSKIKISNGGFTLVELMVASSLFMAIIMISSGAFVQALRNQRSVADLTAANDNLYQAIESIAREVRTGSDFSRSTASELDFQNYRSKYVSYKLVTDASPPVDVVGTCPVSAKYCTLVKCEGAFSCTSAIGVYTPITSSKYSINYFNLYYQGISEDPNDHKPPRITIAVGIKGSQGLVTNIQTTVSSKNLGS